VVERAEGPGQSVRPLHVVERREARRELRSREGG
jgi:hypothetical protein